MKSFASRATLGAVLLSALTLTACAAKPATPAQLLTPGLAASSAPRLAQAGNPAVGKLDKYTRWLAQEGDAAAKLAADSRKADNIVSWQMSHGGFDKNPAVYEAPWNGMSPRSGWRNKTGEELGTIDNDATVSEILFLADVYKRGGKTAHRESARRALDFILTMQYASGGWPQVYPERAGTIYSNYVTLNDDAMARVLLLVDHALQRKAPLEDGFFTPQQYAKLASALDRGVDYLIRAQIRQNGVPTVWCAQHDPADYRPREGRAYELPSKSGKESALVVAFLMTQPQTPEVAASVRAALDWYRRAGLKDTAYLRNLAREGKNPFVASPGSMVWYRFYELNEDKGFFANRAGSKFSDIMKLDAERLGGYEWAGNYAAPLLEYAASVGY